MKPVFISYLKTYLTFSKSERNGILFLFGILIIIIVAIKVFPATVSSSDPNEFLAIQKQIDSLFVKDTIVPAKFKNTSFKVQERPSVQKAKIAVIEINSCDSSALTSLPGIGPVYASRIIKYRNLTGGFYHISQLSEVYGLKDENLIKAKSFITVNGALIRGISADTAAFKTLARHPYIGKEKAWQIINYRKKIGARTFLPEDFENAHIFDSLQWQRVKPYLIFQKNTD